MQKAPFCQSMSDMEKKKKVDKFTGIWTVSCLHHKLIYLGTRARRYEGCSINTRKSAVIVLIRMENSRSSVCCT